MYTLKLLGLVLLCGRINSSAIINRFDECVLSSKLVEEIALYKNVTQQIMQEIINEHGAEMYRE